MQKGVAGRALASGLLLLALASAACGTSMQMSSEDLSRLTPTEGVVVGSVLIKGGTDILGRTGWTLIAQRMTSALSSVAPAAVGYSLNASRGGAEEVFVTKVEAGNYRFVKLAQNGFSTFEAGMNVNFRAQAAKNVYVGRLIIEFPPGVLVAGARFRVKVEDAMESTLSAARQKSGLSLADVVTDLMNN